MLAHIFRIFTSMAMISSSSLNVNLLCVNVLLTAGNFEGVSNVLHGIELFFSVYEIYDGTLLFRHV